MIILKKIFFIIFILLVNITKSFNIFPPKNNINRIKVIHTSILNFVPQLKLHHVVVIPEADNKNIYIADFSPINQTNLYTLTKLIFGFSVPAEIRLRHINLSKFNLTLNNIDNIVNHKFLIDTWYNTTTPNYILSQKVTDQIFKKIKNKKIKNFIAHIKKWNSSMNLYSHNCQHFSSFVEIEKNNYNLN
jgi:hypothetical protein